MGLAEAGVPHRAGGVLAAMRSLEDSSAANAPGSLKIAAG